MLSRKTKYAFKALAYLVEHKDNGPVLISKISEERNISRKFLENILLELKRGGVLNSKKGKGGGYYLKDSAVDTTLSKIIRLMDGPIAMLPCVSLNFYEHCEDCPSEGECGLHLTMIEVRDKTLSVLDNKTIADLVVR